MAYAITQACCADASCVAVCPVDCIHPTPDEPDFGTTEMLYVDAGVCIDCGACADACPVDAIKPIDLLRGGEEVFAQLNADFYIENPQYSGGSHESAPTTFVDAAYAGERPLRIAIVGTGPAASYAARFLLTGTDSRISMLDRLPLPGGLVRAGVAPDHVDTKRFGEQFAWAYSHPRTTMLMNVDVGEDITHDELLEYHDAVIYAVGAHQSRPLGISGEELDGVYAAPDVVGWYNGDPDIGADAVDVRPGRVVIVGNGNVALDIARILLEDRDRLAATDMADYALDALRGCDVREVVLMARRGPEHAAFTRPELLMMPDGIELLVADDPRTAATLDAAEEGTKAALLADLPRISWPASPDNPDSPDSPDNSDSLDSPESAAEPPAGKRRIVMAFHSTVDRAEGPGRIEHLTISGPEGHTYGLPAQTLVRSTGHRGAPVADLPFDEASATVPNSSGRVMDPASGAAIPGAYVVGWIKRGASGGIGVNRGCATETIRTMLSDSARGELTPPQKSPRQLTSLLRRRTGSLITRRRMQAIDRAERKRGRHEGRPRVKFTTRSSLLSAGRRR